MSNEETPHSNESDEVEEQECGVVYDHDEEITHEDESGVYWICRRCGAEGFPDDEDWSDSPTPSGVTSSES